MTFGLIFDCPQQKADWDEYMRKNILCDKDQFCTILGAVRTNQVETVWKALLKVRTKDSNIKGDRYIMVTNVGAVLFNQPYVMQCEGEEDYCCQATFAELLGIDVPCYVRAKWDKMNQARKKASIRRHTKAHKVKTAKYKKAARLRKTDDAKLAKAAKDSYKSAGFRFNGEDDCGSSSGAADSSKGEKMRNCKKCGVDAVHSYRAQMCNMCRKAREDERAKPKKQKTNGKGKVKGKAKRQKVVASDSESELDLTSESDCGSEEEYDESKDEELNTDVAVRLSKMRRNSRIEVKFDTEEGPHWASGIVREVIDKDRGTVKFIDDDESDFPYVLELRDGTWKYL